MSLQLPRTERMKSYIKEILSDGERHSTREITEYVDEKLKRNGDYVFQINSYVNAALRLLMKEGEYNKVAYVQLRTRYEYHEYGGGLLLASDWSNICLLYTSPSPRD